MEKPNAKVTFRARNLIRTWEKRLPEPIIGLMENMIDALFDIDDDSFPQMLEMANLMNFVKSDINERNTGKK